MLRREKRHYCDEQFFITDSVTNHDTFYFIVNNYKMSSSKVSNASEIMTKNLPHAPVTQQKKYGRN